MWRADEVVRAVFWRFAQLPFHRLRFPLLFFAAFLVISAGCSGRHAGAESMKELQTELIESVEDGDLKAAQDMFLDGDELIKACPDKFRKLDTGRFKRKLANGKRRFARHFDQCTHKLDGDIVVNKRSGGEKRRQMVGCGEQVWEYSNIVLQVEADGRRSKVVIDGIVGIEGRYYVVERLACK